MLKGIFSKPYSHLFIVGDNSGWSTDVDAEDLKRFADKVGVKADIVKRMYLNLPQAVHYTSQFSLLLDIYKSRNRLSLDYYHGKPEQGESFRKCFEALASHKDQIVRVRVSTREMEERIGTLIGREKVRRIPIGVNAEIFTSRSDKDREERRKELDIPSDAIVIGSFQKDGSGWGEGLEPKEIKGPDVFLEIISRLKGEIPSLFVLLSGPSRGYVKKGLEELGVPYRHRQHKDYREVAKLYDALDLYLVTSREEGGPKAVLESMAKGVPFVTTEVGQAKDLVKHGQNAMMAAIEDTDALTRLSLEVLRDPALRERLIENGRRTAQENGLENQLPLWKEYFAPLVNS